MADQSVSGDHFEMSSLVFIIGYACSGQAVNLLPLDADGRCSVLHVMGVEREHVLNIRLVQHEFSVKSMLGSLLILLCRCGLHMLCDFIDGKVDNQ